MSNGNLILRIILLLISCAVVGCSSYVRSLFPGPERPVKTYDLRLGGKQCTDSVSSIEIKVIAVLPSLVSQRFLYRPGTAELSFYQFSTWSDPPALMIEPRLQRELVCNLNELGAIQEQLLLTCNLQRFDHDASEKPGNAVIELQCSLVNRTSNQILAKIDKHVAVSATNYDAEGAVQGFDTGLSILARELALAVSSAIKNALQH